MHQGFAKNIMSSAKSNMLTLIVPISSCRYQLSLRLLLLTANSASKSLTYIVKRKGETYSPCLAPILRVHVNGKCVIMFYPGCENK